MLPHARAALHYRVVASIFFLERKDEGGERDACVRARSRPQIVRTSAHQVRALERKEYAHNTPQTQTQHQLTKGGSRGAQHKAQDGAHNASEVEDEGNTEKEYRSLSL